MNKSEKRIWNNKIRRQKERKKHIFLFFLTLSFVMVLSFTASTFLSHAKMKNEEEFKYYKSIVIEEGDTLWSIALQNISSDNSDIHTYIKEVKKMNGLRDDIIIEGMYLIIPCYSNKPSD